VSAVTSAEDQRLEQGLNVSRIETGHRDVEQDDVWSVSMHRGESRRAVRREHDVMAVGAEETMKQRASAALKTLIMGIVDGKSGKSAIVHAAM
jgi:hypothetical protein